MTDEVPLLPSPVGEGGPLAVDEVPLLPSPVGAEGEKMICYIVFDGFRRQTPDCSEPNGDGRIPVSTRAVSRSDG